MPFPTHVVAYPDTIRLTVDTVYPTDIQRTATWLTVDLWAPREIYYEADR